MMLKLLSATKSMSLLPVRRCFFDKVGRNWETAWSEGVIPWDVGKVHPAVIDLIEKGKIKTLQKGNSLVALIPGCGAGYEARMLRNVAGYSHVLGLDISSTAIDIARKGGVGAVKSAKDAFHEEKEEDNGISFKVGDFFTWQGSYDLIFDYLFFSALDVNRRESWAKSCGRLITPGSGRLVTLIFPLLLSTASPETQAKAASEGPPFTVTLTDYRIVLEKEGFELLSYDPVQDEVSIKPRRGKEAVAIWAKK